jgi:hypothetical protein
LNKESKESWHAIYDGKDLMAKIGKLIQKFKNRFFEMTLSDPGTRDCPHGTLLRGYGMGHGPRPISVVTTRNAVGLLVQ